MSLEIKYITNLKKKVVAAVSQEKSNIEDDQENKVLAYLLTHSPTHSPTHSHFLGFNGRDCCLEAAGEAKIT